MRVRHGAAVGDAHGIAERDVVGVRDAGHGNRIRRGTVLVHGFGNLLAQVRDIAKRVALAERVRGQLDGVCAVRGGHLHLVAKAFLVSIPKLAFEVQGVISFVGPDVVDLLDSIQLEHRAGAWREGHPGGRHLQRQGIELRRRHGKRARPILVVDIGQVGAIALQRHTRLLAAGVGGQADGVRPALIRRRRERREILRHHGGRVGRRLQPLHRKRIRLSLNRGESAFRLHGGESLDLRRRKRRRGRNHQGSNQRQRKPRANNTSTFELFFHAVSFPFLHRLPT